MTDVKLYLGDCLEVMRGMPDKSVDAVITDPPYYKVMNHAWDNQWKTIEEYQTWIDTLAIEWRRILKDNGSLYVFCDEMMGAYVQVVLDKHFTYLNNITWRKEKSAFLIPARVIRKYYPISERILFYSAQYDPTGWETVKLDMNNFQPLRDYFRRYQESIGLSKKEIVEAIGQKADHCFRWNSTQWDLPTPETYDELGRLPYNHGFIRREYEDLRREYEDLRREYEDLRRVFHADSNTLDVIAGPIVNAKENTEHPTTKPIWIMRRLIEVSTNPGNTILDCCMGSGTTGVACVQTGRNFIGIEISPEYYAIAERRIREAQPPLI